MLNTIWRLGLAVLVVACGSAARAADAYAVDPVHSSISFKISHVGISYIHGRFNDFSGTFTIDNRIEALPRGASYARRASQSLAYYSIVRGIALVTIGSTKARMAENTSVAIPRGAVATIASAASNTVLAVTVLLPGDCDATPHVCDFP